MNEVRRTVAGVVAATMLIAPLLLLLLPEARRPSGLVAPLLALTIAAATIWLEPVWCALVAVGALIGVSAVAGPDLAAALAVVLLLCSVHWGLRWGWRAVLAAIVAAVAGLAGLIIGHGSDIATLSVTSAGICVAGTVAGIVVGGAIDQRAVRVAIAEELHTARLRADTWADTYPGRRAQALRALDGAVRWPATLPAPPGRFPDDDTATADVENDVIKAFTTCIRSIVGEEVDGEVRVVLDGAWIRMRAVVSDETPRSLDEDPRLRALRTLVEACQGVLTVVDRPGHGLAVHVRVPRLRTRRAQGTGGQVA
jgi:hypothetical protein